MWQAEIMLNRLFRGSEEFTIFTGSTAEMLAALARFTEIGPPDVVFIDAGAAPQNISNRDAYPNPPPPLRNDVLRTILFGNENEEGEEEGEEKGEEGEKMAGRVEQNASAPLVLTKRGAHRT